MLFIFQSSLVIQFTKRDSNQLITVNGVQAYTNVGYTGTLTEGGSTVFTIVVNAQAGNTRTYLITVMRAASSENFLAYLALKDVNTLAEHALTPAFSTSISSYEATVIYSRQEITVTPTASHTHAACSVLFNNVGPAVTASSSSPAYFSLTEGLNYIEVTVTAQDGSTMDYLVRVTRSAVSTDTDLSQISLSNSASAIAMTPAWSASTHHYTAQVANTVSDMTIEADPADAATQQVYVQGVLLTSRRNGYAHSVPLLEGGNTVVYIQVVAEDRSSSWYNITVARDASTDATLSGLRWRNSGDVASDYDVTLVNGNLAYGWTVDNDVGVIAFELIVNHFGAISTVDGVLVTSGSYSGDIILTEGGTTVVSVLVTAQDGITSHNYQISIVRTASDIAFLSSFVPTSGAYMYMYMYVDKNELSTTFLT